jgi:hypothetical protein
VWAKDARRTQAVNAADLNLLLLGRYGWEGREGLDENAVGVEVQLPERSRSKHGVG